MSDPEKPEVPAKPKRDPAALSSEYHKAHKQLMLWATILFIWEFIGVDLTKAQEAGGYVGPIVTALKSPQAVPWVLLILVVYFLFKCSTEWAQCHEDRRKLRFARADFISAWFVAVVAIALYLGQTISRLQFADIIASRRAELRLIALWSAIGFIVFLFLDVGFTFVYQTWRKTGKVKLSWSLAGGLLILGPILTRYFSGRPMRWKTVILGLLIGAAFNVPIWLFLNQSVSSFSRRVSRIRQLLRLSPKN